jgi:hypothetical protein
MNKELTQKGASRPNQIAAWMNRGQGKTEATSNIKSTLLTFHHLDHVTKSQPLKNYNTHATGEPKDTTMVGILIIHTDNILQKNREMGRKRGVKENNEILLQPKLKTTLHPLLCLKAPDVVLGLLFF